MDFEEEVLIPKARIAVLIGGKGVTKRSIEKIGGVKLKIDSKANTVLIMAKDALELMTAKNVVEAIGRGFNPIAAQKLFKDEYGFELFNIGDYAKKTKKHQTRIKGRVIGEQGKAQKVIRKYTGADIAVFGKTVGIIAPHESLQKAREAIERLLSGAQHAGVYKYLEKAT